MKIVDRIKDIINGKSQKEESVSGDAKKTGPDVFVLDVGKMNLTVDYGGEYPAIFTAENDGKKVSLDQITPDKVDKDVQMYETSKNTVICGGEIAQEGHLALREKGYMLYPTSDGVYHSNMKVYEVEDLLKTNQVGKVTFVTDIVKGKEDSEPNSLDDKALDLE